MKVVFFNPEYFARSQIAIEMFLRDYKDLSSEIWHFWH